MNDAGFLPQLLEWFTAPERWQGATGIPWRVFQHVAMSFVSVGAALLIAFPLGLWIGHTRRLEFLVVSIANAGRAIPSFGLLLLFVAVFGVGLGFPPALRPAILFALVLLAIPPILTNTYVGVQQVDADTLEAARGMGLTERQVLLGLELPLAAPVVIAGIRTATLQVIATATLAAVAAGGGLGRYIVDGFALGRDGTAQAFAGAVLVALLALAIDGLLGALERTLSPLTASRTARPAGVPSRT